MKKHLILIIALLGLSSGCTDIDDNLHFRPMASQEDVILKNTDLYTFLERVTTDDDNPLEKITCIEFIYPIRIKIYDAELYEIEELILIGDEDFSAFLGSLPEDQALSISYPIETTLADGTNFSVNNNSELKVAIDSCSEEDIIVFCGSVFCNIYNTSEPVQCVWNAEYVDGNDNTYAGGTFLINADYSLVFTYDGTEYPGNWIFLFVDDILHININLEGSSEVAQYWNIDRPVIFSENHIEILNGENNISLTRKCENTAEYFIGDEGPAGGIVFYDKGEYSDGWRYMEVSTEDLGIFEWGCVGTVTGAMETNIGSGLLNSIRITNQHDALDNYYENPGICNILNDGTVAAQKAIIFNIENTDWFLPSTDELMLVYDNLHLAGFGDFSQANYWTSSEVDAETAHGLDFNSGTIEVFNKNPAVEVKIIAVRYF